VSTLNLTLPEATLTRPSRRPPLTPAISFAALALFGASRWATLINPSPSGRVIAVALVGCGVALAVRLLLAVSRLAALAVIPVGVALLLLSCGWPWQMLWHLRLGLFWTSIRAGLESLPHTLVPYTGPDLDTERTILLGAAALLLLAAVAPLLLPRRHPLGVRLVATLPLLALAVLPTTLMHPAIPDGQGLLLLALLAANLWSGRRRDAGSTPLVLAVSAAVVAVAAAGWVRQPRAWVNPETLAGPAQAARAAFDWTQSYGPLAWSRRGLQVFTVSARRGEYWKTEDLDTFDGAGWSLTHAADADPAGGVSAAARQRWTQTIQVTVGALSSGQVIAAGQAARPQGLRGALPGPVPGTWVDPRGLRQGSSYTVSVYDPAPTLAQLDLARDERGTPAAWRELWLPTQAAAGSGVLPFTFGAFGTGQPAVGLAGHSAVQAEQAIDQSPYGGVYALARRLTAGARRPYDVVAATLRLLSHGYRYDEDPPHSALPLVTFLEQSRAGYCQHFAGAMALLLRMAGIPARVSTGFTSGGRDSSSGRWQVEDLNAHAWVEAWFPGLGWVTFDPTPGGDPAISGATPTALRALPADPGAGLAPSHRRRPRARSAARILSSASSPVGKSRAGGRGGAPSQPWLLGGGAILLVLLAPALIIVRLRPAQEAEQLAELERAMRRMGRPLTPELTLAALAHRLRDDPPAADYVRALERRRYGVGGDAPSARGRRALRRALREGCGAGGALRSVWALPPRWVLLH
jgi:hypothetical protein